MHVREAFSTATNNSYMTGNDEKQLYESQVTKHSNLSLHALGCSGNVLHHVFLIEAEEDANVTADNVLTIIMPFLEVPKLHSELPKVS